MTTTASINASLARVYGVDAVKLNSDYQPNTTESDRATSVALFNTTYGVTSPFSGAGVVRLGGADTATTIRHLGNTGNTSLTFNAVENGPFVFYLSESAGLPVESFRIDAAGRFLRPGQRMFHARYSNAATWAAGGVIIFNDVQANVGSNYNATTGIFTAPYTGLYLFTVHILMSTTTTADTRIAFRKNNAAYAGASFIRSAAVAGVNSLYGTAIFDLNANDNVRVIGVSASTQFYVSTDNANYSGFCGYMLG